MQPGQPNASHSCTQIGSKTAREGGPAIPTTRQAPCGSLPPGSRTPKYLRVSGNGSFPPLYHLHGMHLFVRTTNRADLFAGPVSKILCRDLWESCDSNCIELVLECGRNLPQVGLQVEAFRFSAAF